MAKRYTLLFLLFFAAAYSQQTIWDSLNVKYRLLQSNYSPYEDIIKIKIPPYLTTSQVMHQVRLVVQWPGDPLPKKKTTVYVFKDDAIEGDKSKTGGIYFPKKGFKWDLRDWQPDFSILEYEPGMKDKLIYNTLLDSIFSNGMYSLEFENENHETKESVARKFALSVSELDSIYYRVKWWWDLEKSRKDN